MPPPSGIQHVRDLAGLGRLKQRRAADASTTHDNAGGAGTHERATSEPGADGGWAPTPPRRPSPPPPPAGAHPTSLDDIDADDPAAAVGSAVPAATAVPAVPPSGSGAAAPNEDDDSDDEELLRMELERVRAKAKAAEAKRKAATTAAASKRYDADVLFRCAIICGSGPPRQPRDGREERGGQRRDDVAAIQRPNRERSARAVPEALLQIGWTTSHHIGDSQFRVQFHTRCFLSQFPCRS